MESLVSDHAVASHREQAVAARGQYFRAERRRGEDWPTIAFIRRTSDLTLGLQLGSERLDLLPRFGTKRCQSRLGRAMRASRTSRLASKSPSPRTRLDSGRTSDRLHSQLGYGQSRVTV